MKQRLFCCIFFFAILGCDQITLHEAESGERRSGTLSDAETPSSKQFISPMVVGTHLIGEDSFDEFTPLMDGGKVPIVYGPQGAYMVILSIQLPHWAENTASISISTHFGEEIVASLFYPDLSVEPTPDGAYISNLFMLTNNWEEYMEEALLVEIHCTGQQLESHTDLILHFTSPQNSFF